MAKGDRTATKKRTRNEAERAFRDWAEANGWRATKRGWPDFFCWKDVNGDRQIMAVEVKKNINRHLRREQAMMFRELQKFGLACFMWTPEPDKGGLRKASCYGYPDEPANP